MTLLFSTLEERVDALYADYKRLLQEVTELGNRIAAWPTPPRDGWERHSCCFELVVPSESTESHVQSDPTDPISESFEFDPQELKPCSPQIASVEYDGEYVSTFDQAGDEIPDLSGPFTQVGMRVLAEAGGLRWKTVPCRTQKLARV